MSRDSALFGGTSLATLAAAFFAFQQLSTPAPARSGAPEAAAPPSAASARKPTAKEIPYRRGEELLEAHLGGSVGGAGCANGARCRSLDVLVATLPDPHDTRLDWAYDANLESIRRAFEASDYVLDRFWLPPADATVAVRTPGDTARADTVPVRQVQPGVVLFRHATRPDSLRLLYLVGELPTGGVHQRALRNALRERQKLFGNPGIAFDSARYATLEILGPTFSGSAHSLRQGLEPWLDDVVGIRSVRIVSGNATDAENRRHLTFAQPVVREKKTGVIPVTFAATLHSDASLLSAFDSLVRRSMGWDSSQVALLRESGTSWSARWAETAGNGEEDAADTTSPRRPDPDQAPGYLVISFPSNISGLRDEYERNPAPRSASPGAAQVERVPLTLREEPHPTESPVPTSALTTPAADEVMDEIVKTLLHHDVRVVGIQSTDVRDRLFLAQRLRARMRDVQLVAFEGNMLYLREEYTSSLRGMLVLSSYPLFLQNQWWAADHARTQKRAFPTDAAQATFNAALVLLDNERALVEYRGWPALPGEAAAARPPVWLTAVGRSSFVPVTVLRDPPGAREYVHAASPVSLPAAPGGRGPVAVPAVPRVPGAAGFMGGIFRGDAASAGARNAMDPHSAGFVAQGFTLLVGMLLLTVCGEYIRTRRLRLAELAPARPRPAKADAPRWAPGLPLREQARAVAVQAGGVGRSLWRFARGAPARASGHAVETGVLGGSILLHREIYTCLRFVALGALFLPSFVLVWRGGQPWWGLSLLFFLLAVTWSFAFLSSIGLGLRVLSCYFRDGLVYGRAAGVFWWLEVWGRVAVVALGMTFSLLTAGYVLHLARFGEDQPLAFEVFFHRAVQVDSGVSPLVPLLLSSVGFAVWCTWHLGRLERLSRIDAFEADFLERGRELAWERPAAEPATPEERMARAVDDARIRLFQMIPNGWGAGLLAFLCLMAVWLLGQFAPTLEAVAGPPAPALPRLSELGWFDLLFRFGVLGTLMATPWAVYRLLAVWRAQRRCMEVLEATPLLAAFRHLPQTAAEVTRLTLVGPPARHVLDALVAERWRAVRDRYAGGEFAALLKDREPAAAFENGEQKLEALRALMEAGEPWRTQATYREREAVGTPFRTLRQVVDPLWARETQAERTARLAARGSGREEIPAGAPQRLTPALRAWLTAAEDFMALQAVDYLGWVLDQIRRLAFFLFLALILTTVLLSSYPFHPQAVVKLVFLGVLLATVGALLVVLTQMNSEPVLSAIAGTDPGRVNLDRDFVLNVALVGVVPLLTLVGSEYEGVRNVLFAWVGPLLKVMSGG